MQISSEILIQRIFFLLFLSPLAAYMENQYDIKLDKKDVNLYSIKISNNEMWIKNEIDELNYNFINIKKINLKDMNAKDIEILMVNEKSNKLILAEDGEFSKNLFILKNVSFYDFKNENYQKLDSFNLNINFNKDNIINSISKYQLVPYYNYLDHTKTLKKFNLYSNEIGLYYLSEILKPFFIVVLAFVILGFTSKFQRNENFFKVLFISISIGFIIFLLKEIISKLTISLSLNFLLSYLIIFLIPLFIGLYQVNKIENE